ncbi:MAG: helix-turn-helix transcriptional regulator [Bacteroidota bacterium]
MKEIIQIETISQVHTFYGFSKPNHPLVSVIPINDAISNFDYGDKSYALNLYQVSLKLGISGSLSYGRNSYDFQEGTMVFSKPNQVLKVVDQTHMTDSAGWTLFFHPDLIRKSELGRTIEDYSFFSYEVHEALHLSEKERISLTDLVHKIEEEYQQNIDRHSQKLIVSNIELILDYCTRFYDRQFYTRTNLNKDVVSQFDHLLRTYYNSDRPSEMGMLTVKVCGTDLNMSPHYLSDLLRKETGKSAQEHIYQYVISKAKTLLLSTQEPISQIAYSLGFTYSQHFSKLFKAKTGMTPGQYRQIA